MRLYFASFQGLHNFLKVSHTLLKSMYIVLPMLHLAFLTYFKVIAIVTLVIWQLLPSDGYQLTLLAEDRQGRAHLFVLLHFG